MSMSQIDSATLRSIAQESQESQTIFQSLEARKRTRKITDLRQLQYKLLDEGAKLTKEDVMHTFQRLEDAGVGSLIIGRKGKPTRFKWNYSIKRVAMAAKEPRSFRHPKKTKRSSSFSKSFTPDEFREKVESLIPSSVHAKNIRAVMSTSIKLREGFTAKIEIPLDMTKEDAARLSEIIKSLVPVQETNPRTGHKTTFKNAPEEEHGLDNYKENKNEESAIKE